MKKITKSVRYALIAAATLVAAGSVHGRIEARFRARAQHTDSVQHVPRRERVLRRFGRHGRNASGRGRRNDLESRPVHRPDTRGRDGGVRDTHHRQIRRNRRPRAPERRLDRDRAALRGISRRQGGAGHRRQAARGGRPEHPGLRRVGSQLDAQGFARHRAAAQGREAAHRRAGRRHATARAHQDIGHSLLRHDCRRGRIRPARRFHGRVQPRHAPRARRAQEARRHVADHRPERQRRRHTAGGRQDSLPAGSQRDRSRVDERPYRRTRRDVHDADRPDRYADARRRAGQQPVGLGCRDRLGRAARSGPRRTARPADLRQGTRAIDPPARLQCLSESHYGQVLHSQRTVHSGARLRPPQRRRQRRNRTRLADPGVPGPPAAGRCTTGEA